MITAIGWILWAIVGLGALIGETAEDAGYSECRHSPGSSVS